MQTVSEGCHTNPRTNSLWPLKKSQHPKQQMLEGPRASAISEARPVQTTHPCGEPKLFQCLLMAGFCLKLSRLSRALNRLTACSKAVTRLACFSSEQNRAITNYRESAGPEFEPRTIAKIRLLQIDGDKCLSRLSCDGVRATSNHLAAALVHDVPCPVLRP